ncbi:MAG: sodium:solute symporter family protein [Luteitalea sp.]|nr:sodium:solute symporter family protein [Luteitalea sp.]
MASSNFTALDWGIVVAYLAFSLGVGFRVKRHVEDLPDYLVAGRRVRLALGVATFVATEIGTVSFVYLAELGYVAGFACFVIGLLQMAAYALVGGTGFIVAGLRRAGVMTIPEYYERRFGRGVRLLGGTILFAGGVLNMGIFLKFDGILLSEVMGFGPEAIARIMAVMLVIVISYTVLGGMFSVVVTDFLQFVVLAVGMLAATVAVLMALPPAQLSAAVADGLGTAGVNALVNPRFGWVFLVWVFVSNVAAAAIWQPATSKALASESPEVARKMYLFTGLAFAGRAMIPMLWGVAALAYFGSDLPTTAAMPRLLATVVPSGLLGLLVAGMLAASMSTYSAYMLAWSSVLARDVIGCVRPTALPERTTMWIARCATGFIGVFLLVFGLWYEIPATAYQYLFITGAMYTSGAIGCVAAGLYWPRANVAGAYGALLCGAAAPAGFLLLERMRDDLPSWLGFITDVNVSGLLGFGLAAFGMLAGSLLTTTPSAPPTPVTPVSKGP